jgi:hypothetical protein
MLLRARRMLVCVSQVHDILDWSFTSLRLDAPSYPTPVVNGVGAFECGDAAVCVHR